MDRYDKTGHSVFGGHTAIGRAGRVSTGDKYCTNCAEGLKYSVKYWKNCGTLTKPPPPLCYNCKTEILLESRFCGNCGDRTTRS